MLAVANPRVGRFVEAQNFRLRARQRDRLGLRIGLALGALTSLAVLLSAARGGVPKWLWLLLAGLAAIALICGTLGMLLLLVPRFRIHGSAPLVGGATFLGMLLLPLMLAYEPMHEAALRRLVRSASPVVAAIRAHEERHGVPPPSLDALIPELLAELPRATLWCPTEFAYAPTPPNSDTALPWTLRVPTASGESLLYLPTYETTRMWLPYHERCGDWILGFEP